MSLWNYVSNRDYFFSFFFSFCHTLQTHYTIDNRLNEIFNEIIYEEYITYGKLYNIIIIRRLNTKIHKCLHITHWLNTQLQMWCSLSDLSFFFFCSSLCVIECLYICVFYASEEQHSLRWMAFVKLKEERKYMDFLWQWFLLI